MSTKPSRRVEKLRERWFTYKRTLNTDRIRIYTRAFRETEGEPQVIRRAKAFAAVAREIPINIYPDEWTEGRTTGE
jgi:formate C-acetyltransferase